MKLLCEAEEMEVTYENTHDQVADFYRCELKSNPQLKKQKIQNTAGTPLLVFGGFALLAFAKDDPALAIAGFVGGLFTLFLSLRHYRRFPEILVRNQVNAVSLDNVMCQHTVKILSNGFEERTSETLSAGSWRSLYKVDFTEDYVFIFPIPGTAHIIPRIGLGDEQFTEFSRLVKQYYDARKATLP